MVVRVHPTPQEQLVLEIKDELISKFKSKNKMKNLVLAFTLLMATTFASCSTGNATSETPAVDSTEVVTDTVETVDSLVIEADSLAVDSIL